MAFGLHKKKFPSFAQGAWGFACIAFLLLIGGPIEQGKRHRSLGRFPYKTLSDMCSQRLLSHCAAGESVQNQDSISLFAQWNRHKTRTLDTFSSFPLAAQWCPENTAMFETSSRPALLALDCLRPLWNQGTRSSQLSHTLIISSTSSKN